MSDRKSGLVSSLAPSPGTRPFPYDPAPPRQPNYCTNPPSFGYKGVSVCIRNVSVPDIRPPSSGVGKRGCEPVW